MFLSPFKSAISALAVVFCIWNAGCSRAPIREVSQAMRPASAPDLDDDLPLVPLMDAIESQIVFLENSPAHSTFRFGPKTLSKAEYLSGLRRFVELGKIAPSKSAFFELVRREFDFYEVYGKEGWGEVFITSYYEPLVQGSLKESARFSQPIYSTPEDLVSLNLAPFDPKYAEDRKLRGRLDGKKLVPYYSREEIDSGKALKGRKLEICWLDPIDAFFLQIQGSGTVELEDGRRLRINYAEKNGHRYESVGNFLKDRIPFEKMNLRTIEDALRAMTPDERQKIFNRNASYVFFKASESSAVTYLGVPANDGRTIATDPKYFPKGALALLSTSKPRFDSVDAADPVSFEPLSRFVLDQDIGGAIQGPGRVDLFWGRGHEAKRSAGFMKQTGTLYYLVPKTGARL